jgi:hypothetical protein
MSDPNQRSIEAMLAGIDRVRVVPFSNYVEGRAPEPILIDTADPRSLASFRTCFAIVEDPSSFGHCMCPGDPHIELYARKAMVAKLSYHHGYSIRWDAWSYDAVLSEPDRLLDWMSEHGAPGPRAAVEEARQRAEEGERDARRWLAAMPAPLRPFWESLEPFPDRDLYQPSLEALRALPSVDAQVLALLGWFGSGAGPWSGCPSYESVAQDLLLHFAPQLMIDALAGTSPTDAQLVGASRYFAGWGFWQRYGADGMSLLSPALKQRLLVAAEETGIEDNIERAQVAFR